MKKSIAKILIFSLLVGIISISFCSCNLGGQKVIITAENFNDYFEIRTYFSDITSTGGILSIYNGNYNFDVTPKVSMEVKQLTVIAYIFSSFSTYNDSAVYKDGEYDAVKFDVPQTGVYSKTISAQTAWSYPSFISITVHDAAGTIIIK
jgi:hypothetical protein